MDLDPELEFAVCSSVEFLSVPKPSSENYKLAWATRNTAVKAGKIWGRF